MSNPSLFGIYDMSIDICSMEKLCLTASGCLLLADFCISFMDGNAFYVVYVNGIVSFTGIVFRIFRGIEEDFINH